MSNIDLTCASCGDPFDYLDLDDSGWCTTCNQTLTHYQNEVSPPGECFLCQELDTLTEEGFCTECAALKIDQDWEETINEFLGPEHAEIEDACEKERTIAMAKKNETKTPQPTPAQLPSVGVAKPSGNYITGLGANPNATTGKAATFKTYTPKKPCHHIGEKVIFSIDGRDFVAANSQGIDTAVNNGCKAVIDCAGVSPKFVAKFVEAPDKYCVLTPIIEFDRIRLNWKDMGTPPVGREFWQRMVALLPKGTVAVCCIGGHGRTGTALASLLVANSVMSASEAVDFVRSQHCKKAVESASQEMYLERLQTKAQMLKDKAYLQKVYPGWLAKQIKTENHHYGWATWAGYQKEVKWA